MDRNLIQKFELAITQCESLQEFETLIHEQSHVFADDWGDYFRTLSLTKYHLTYEQIAEACNISIDTVKSYYRRVPAKRRDVIFLAMLMGMTVEETNDLLVNRAKYHRLYARNPDDVICIYLLVLGCRHKPASVFEAYKKQYQELEKQYHQAKKKKKTKATATRTDTNFVQHRVVEQAQAATLDPTEDVTFQNLTEGLFSNFSESYQKLIDFIESYFNDRETEENKRMNNENLFHDRDQERKKEKKLPLSHRRVSPNEIFGDDESYLKKYYTAISNMHRNHTAPSRIFLISLGVRLSMPQEKINHMLDLAGLGPLCANDRLDAAIVYILEELEGMSPSTFYAPDSLGGTPQFNDLQEVSLSSELPRLQALASHDPQSQICTDMWEDFHILKGLQEQTLNEYLKWRLGDMNIFQGSSQVQCKKLMELL